MERKSPIKSRASCLLSARFMAERDSVQRIDDMAESWLPVKYRRDLRSKGKLRRQYAVMGFMDGEDRDRVEPYRRISKVRSYKGLVSTTYRWEIGSW